MLCPIRPPPLLSQITAVLTVKTYYHYNGIINIPVITVYRWRAYTSLLVFPAWPCPRPPPPSATFEVEEESVVVELNKMSSIGAVYLSPKNLTNKDNDRSALFVYTGLVEGSGLLKLGQVLLTKTVRLESVRSG